MCSRSTGRTSALNAPPAVTALAERWGVRIPPTACSFSASRCSRAEGVTGPRRAVGWATRSSGEPDCQAGL
eukprot:177302-Alexandrium_andersonii.AAC.1